MRHAQPNLIMHIHLLWEPWKSSQEAVDTAIADIRHLGFNAISLESKPWEEFYQYYENGTEHDYIIAINRAIDACGRYGLKHSWMGYWAYGDNLDLIGVTDMQIRMGDICQLPEAVEDTFYYDRHYKHWSPKMLDNLVAHHRGLIEHFPDRCVDLKSDRPSRLIFGCELAPGPSFDEDGRQRYRSWLSEQYGGEIASFNAIYGTECRSFDEIPPEVYWANYLGDHAGSHPYWRHWHPDAADFLEAGVLMHQWADNRRWIMEESAEFVRQMQLRYDEQNLGIGFWVNVEQWKLFLQDANFFWWWHCGKAADPWRMAQYALEVSSMVNPSDVYHQSSSAALATELALQRSINHFEPFLGSLFLGQHMHGDVYTKISPAQALATTLAAGASGVNVYGYNGLDDGGAFCQMPWDARESLRSGLAWFDQVAPQLEGMPHASVAILFPLATLVLEPVESIEEARGLTQKQCHGIDPIPPQEPLVDFSAHRQEVLGWYQVCREGQFGVEALHPLQIETGLLDRFSALIIPWAPAYRWMPEPEMETAIVEWVRHGGLLICGPDDTMLPEALRTAVVPHEPQIIDVGEPLKPEGVQIAAFPDLTPIACYQRSGMTAIGKMPYGQGTVIRFGFHVGASYAYPFVQSVSMGTDECFFPINLLKRNIIAEILRQHDVMPLWDDASGIWWKGIDVTRFDNGWMIINTTHAPWPLPVEWQNRAQMMLGGDTTRLHPRDAAWIPDSDQQ